MWFIEGGLKWLRAKKCRAFIIYTTVTTSRATSQANNGIFKQIIICDFPNDFLQRLRIRNENNNNNERQPPPTIIIYNTRTNRARDATRQVCFLISFYYIND